MKAVPGTRMRKTARLHTGRRPPREPSGRHARAARGGLLRVLNIDDDAAWRLLKSRTLESAGYEVIEAATGADALSLAHSHRPALVLLDVHLPGLDGFEVCRRLKSDPDTQTIPVVHVTAARVTDADWALGLES